MLCVPKYDYLSFAYKSSHESQKGLLDESLQELESECSVVRNNPFPVFVEVYSGLLQCKRLESDRKDSGNKMKKNFMKKRSRINMNQT